MIFHGILGGEAVAVREIYLPNGENWLSNVGRETLKVSSSRLGCGPLCDWFLVLRSYTENS
jgi:hypothetical protein